MELLAVVTILGIIAAIIVPRVTSGADLAKTKTCNHNCAHIASVVERYREATGTWPSADLNEVDGALDYLPDGIPLCPVSGAPYVLDTAGDLYRVDGHTDGNHSP